MSHREIVTGAGVNEVPPMAAPPLPPDTEISAIQEKENERSLIADEVDARTAQLHQMFIENPAEAEKLLLNGDAEDLDDPNDEET